MSAKEEAEWWSDPPGGLEANAWGMPPYDAEEVARHIVAVLRCDGRHGVLDLGCGPGRTANEVMTYSDAMVIGVDASPAMVDAALANDVAALLGDGRALPPGLLRFDHAYAITLFQHVEHDVTRSYIQQVHDKLPAGGCFLFTHSIGDDPQTFLHHQVAHPEIPRRWAEEAGFGQVVAYGPDDLGWTWYLAMKGPL